MSDIPPTFDKHGNRIIYNNVSLPKCRGASMDIARRLRKGQSVKADSANEAQVIANSIRAAGGSARQYKTGRGYWWVQKIR